MPASFILGHVPLFDCHGWPQFLPLSRAPLRQELTTLCSCLGGEDGKSKHDCSLHLNSGYDVSRAVISLKLATEEGMVRYHSKRTLVVVAAAAVVLRQGFSV